LLDCEPADNEAGTLALPPITFFLPRARQTTSRGWPRARSISRTLSSVVTSALYDFARPTRHLVKFADGCAIGKALK